MVEFITIGDQHSEALKKNHKTDKQKEFQYLASFPPSLPATFINMFTDEGDTVLDPFCGKGTTPLQALVMNRNAIANDMSMVAFTYSHSRIKHVKEDVAMRGIDNMREECKDIDVNPHEFEPLLYMYHFDTLMDILRTRIYLMEKFDDVSMFIKAHICGILYGAGPNDLTMDLPGTFPINLANIKKYTKEHGMPEYKDFYSSLKNKIKIANRTGVPKLRGSIFSGDASILDTKIEHGTVDFIVTSPPYINLIAYGEKTWIMQWFTGQDYKAYDKKTKAVGSCSGNEDEYFDLMKRVLQAMYNVLKDNSACVFVVGGSKRDAKDKGMMHIPMKFVKVGREVGFEVQALYSRGFQSSIRTMFDKDTREATGIGYQDASIVFVKGEVNQRMTFEEGISYGTMKIEDIDELSDIDVSEFD